MLNYLTILPKILEQILKAPMITDLFSSARSFKFGTMAIDGISDYCLYNYRVCYYLDGQLYLDVQFLGYNMLHSDF